MNLSAALKSRLYSLKSRIVINSKGSELAFNVRYNRYLPYFHRTDRRFKIEKINNETDFTILLFEDKPKPYFMACASVRGYDELARLLYEWLDKRSSVASMIDQFTDFESVKPFDIQDLDKERESLWFSIKCKLFFYYVVYWNLKKPFANYEKLLSEAKEIEALKIYYPSISHHYLRFKTSRNYSESKYVPGYLMATDSVKGDFLVSVSFLFSKESNNFFTNDPKEAIDFFVSKCVSEVENI
jgi:hypothetical protein